MERGILTSSVVQYDVVYRPELPIYLIMTCASSPDYLTSEVLVLKYSIHHNLDVMTSGWITMQVDGSGWSQYLLHPKKSQDHVSKISQKLWLCFSQAHHPQTPELCIEVIYITFLHQPRYRT